ncbi:MAG: T9SS type A sorting domain-containing protein [Bacteroidales bacterium]|nr:T9SS type A sorting domain-containing protein [Bacteroidales bacterium]
MSQTADSIQAHFTVFQVDSLIQANATNPDFCVMDVRTPAEYTPEHLEAAINRNYNGAGFDSLIDLLPRHKMYVLYCLSGGRSGSTYNKMVALGFPSIVNMLGGITDWKNQGFPTTPDFAPLQMAVSDTVIPDDTVTIGNTDTISITVTNRANTILQFTSVTSLAGTEFSTDFDITTTLEGPFDYTFFIYYTPVDTLTDSLTFRIESNGGPVQFHIWRTGKMPLVGEEEYETRNLKFEIRNYPNPFSTSTTIEFDLEKLGEVEFLIYNQFGQIIDSFVHQGQVGLNRLTWVAGSLPVGIYFCRIVVGNKMATKKMVSVR